MNSHRPEMPLAQDVLPTLAEPFAFALITWPAAALAAAWSADGQQAWSAAALLWLAVFHAAAYRRGAAFGNVMLLMSAIAAWSCTTFPSPWAYAAFPLLLIGLHGAQRALLRRRSAAEDALPAASQAEPTD